MLIGAVVGAVAGAATSAISQAVSGQGVDWGEVGKQAAVGAVAGWVARTWRWRAVGRSS